MLRLLVMFLIIWPNRIIIGPVVLNIIRFGDLNNATAWANFKVTQLLTLVWMTRNFALPSPPILQRISPNTRQFNARRQRVYTDVSLCVPLDADEKDSEHGDCLRNNANRRFQEVEDGHKNHEVYLLISDQPTNTVRECGLTYDMCCLSG